MKRYIPLLTTCASLLLAQTTYAQQAAFLPFETAPLASNPAFTGMFNGDIRVNMAGRTEWWETGTTFTEMASSFDMPVICRKNAYVAAGLQLYNSAAFSSTKQVCGMASLSFHQALGKKADIGIGIQGGYYQSTHVFDREFYEAPGVGSVFYNGKFVNNVFTFNTGLSFSHAPVERFNYTLGAAVKNVTEPVAGKEFKEVLKRYYTINAGANWQLSDRFALRPAVCGDGLSDYYRWTAGSEFRYTLNNRKKAKGLALFAGTWYRTDNASIVTVGVESKRIRASIGCDVSIFSELTPALFRGAEAALRYIVPDHSKKKYHRLVPSTRF